MVLQANGLDELYKQTLQNMLVKYSHQKKEVWYEFLDTCVYAYNTSVLETMAFSPVELVFGRKAVLVIDPDIDKCDHSDILRQEQEYNPEPNVSITAVEQMVQHHQQLLKVPKANIKKQQEKQKELYDRKHACPSEFAVGEKVSKKDFTRKRRQDGSSLQLPICNHQQHWKRAVQT